MNDDLCHYSILLYDHNFSPSWGEVAGFRMNLSFVGFIAYRACAYYSDLNFTCMIRFPPRGSV